MLAIRLKRVGRRNDPSFRIVVTEKHRGPKSGKYIESVGFYNPHTDTRQVDGERVKYWIDNGAQVSDTVHNILVTEKVIDGKKINVLPQKSPVVAEKEEVDEPKAEQEPENTKGEGAEEAEKAEEVTEETQHEGTTDAQADASTEESAPEEAPAEDVENDNSDLSADKAGEATPDESGADEESPQEENSSEVDAQE